MAQEQDKTLLVRQSKLGHCQYEEQDDANAQQEDQDRGQGAKLPGVDRDLWQACTGTM